MSGLFAAAPRQCFAYGITERTSDSSESSSSGPTLPGTA